MNRKALVKAMVRVGALVAVAGAMAVTAAPAHAGWAWVGSWGSWVTNGNVGSCQTTGGTLGSSSSTTSQVAAWSPIYSGMGTQAQGWPSNNTVVAGNVTAGWSNTVWGSAPNNTHNRCRVGVWVQ